MNLKKYNNRALTIMLMAVTGLIMVNFALLFFSFEVLQKSEKAKSRSESIVSVFNNIWDHLKSSDLGIRSYLLNNNEDMLGPHLIAREMVHQNFARLDSMLKTGNIFYDDFKKYQEQYWKKIDESDQIVSLVRSGDRNQAMKIFGRDSGFELYHKYYAPLQKNLIIHENENIDKATSLYRNFIGYIKISSGLLILLSVPVLIVVIILLREQHKKRKSLYIKLQQSNKQYIFNDGNQEQNYDEDDAINQIVNNLEKSSGFIDKIAGGEYNVEWQGMKKEMHEINRSNLAGNLIKMRDKMKKAKNEDSIRIWATEGHSKFAAITRKHENQEEMVSEFIIELVKYLNMNLGMLFVKKEAENSNDDEEQVILNLEASYAYGRKKYIEKQLKPGQGLSGQVYLEGKSTYLKKVPKDYLKIKSGMGESIPKVILIVPIKHNEQVVGVLEMASFQALETYHITFVEEITTILASAIVNSEASIITQNLLKTTQEQAEVLRMQEEEMRQNMEELEATQEEMRRQNAELERANQLLLEEKARLQSELSLKIDQH
ncbi:MAG: GAF domain-containing protein [Cyclobacteriaceae bacterium]